MKVFGELLRDTLFSLVFNIAPRTASALLFILIGHWAGPAQAGIFSLALTYLLILTTTMRGLDDLLIRQVSREPEQAPHYLSNFLGLRLGLSLLGYGLAVFTVLRIVKYSAATAVPILILTLTVVPDSLAFVAQASLIGQRRFAAPAMVLSVTSLFQLVGGGLVLVIGGSLQQIVWVWVAGSLGGMVVLLGIALSQAGRLQARDWIDWSPIRRNWRVALTFFSIVFIMTLEYQVDVVILSVYRNATEVGWYYAATTIIAGLTMLSRAYWLAVFPLLTRYALNSLEKVTELYKRSIRYIVALVVPMVVGMELLAPQVVNLVFGAKFQATSAILQFISLALVFMFLSDCTARVLQVHDRQINTLWIVMSSLSVNVILNFIFDPLWGSQGAALARIGSTAVFFLLSYGYVKLTIASLGIMRFLAKPIVATCVMAFAVWFVRGWPLLFSVSLGIIAYGVVLYLVRWFTSEDFGLLKYVVAELNRRLRPGYLLPEE